MNPGTRDRLLQSAAQLFATGGYRGASIRDICDLAGANPGAVSYHFGGKRQLYRTVLRQAAESLAAAASNAGDGASERGSDLRRVVEAIFERVLQEPVATRLLIRDLADGGGVAVEALEPPLRTALENLVAAAGLTDAPRPRTGVELLLLEVAGPILLLTVAWPLVARMLDAEDDDRRALFGQLLDRNLARSPSQRLP
jgi:AcrR family transcriptional regulator